MNKRRVFFVLAVMVQLGLLAAVPGQKLITLRTGKTIHLKIRPVDPYTIMSGYYLNLAYAIGSPPHLPKISQEHQTVYVLLAPGTGDCWEAETTYESFPENVPADRLVIKGRYTHQMVKYGIEAYYIPEEKSQELEKNLRQHIQDARAEVKVDRWGNASLAALWIQNTRYEF